MTVYRVSCEALDDEQELVFELFYEESKEPEPLLAIYNKPLDKEYLLKLSRDYPEIKSLRVSFESRDETTDWMKKKLRVEPLP